uniref:Uncharacterized protein n=1 Tax=Heterorhabditis bacteriophora TaxID=37862 RepID=A0A1I7WHA2_HETBA
MPIMLLSAYLYRTNIIIIVYNSVPNLSSSENSFPSILKTFIESGKCPDDFSCERKINLCSKSRNSTTNMSHAWLTISPSSLKQLPSKIHCLKCSYRNHTPLYSIVLSYHPDNPINVEHDGGGKTTRNSRLNSYNNRNNYFRCSIPYFPL